MNKAKPETDVSRRDFITKAGLSAGVAGAVALTVGGDAKAASAGESGKGAGYRETDHVRTYYSLAKF